MYIRNKTKETRGTLTPKKSYSISIKSKNGNTVGFINLSSQFLRAVLGINPDDVRAEDILTINNDDFASYIKSLDIEVTSVEAGLPIDATDF
jgi:hypothetical protein